MDPEGTGETEAEDEIMHEMDDEPGNAPSLPEPEMGTLEAVAEILLHATAARLSAFAKIDRDDKDHTFRQCEALGDQIMREKFIPKLLEIFEMWWVAKFACCVAVGTRVVRGVKGAVFCARVCNAYLDSVARPQLTKLASGAATQFPAQRGSRKRGWSAAPVPHLPQHRPLVSGLRLRRAV